MCEVELRRDGGIEGEDSNALLLCSQERSSRLGDMERVRFETAQNKRGGTRTSPLKLVLRVRLNLVAALSTVRWQPKPALSVDPPIDIIQ